MSNIFVMGGASFDTIIRLPKNPMTRGTYLAEDAYDRCGSTGVAKSLALQKLGVQVTFHTLLGNDSEGRGITSHLKKSGIHLVTDPDPSGTELHFNLIDEDGDRISIRLPRARDHTTINKVRLLKLIEEASLIVLNIMEYNRPLIPHLKGKRVWTDLQDYMDGDSYYDPFIDISEVIFMSSERLMEIGRASCRERV